MSTNKLKNLCIYPFVHAQIDTDGSLLSCCEVKLSDRLALVSNGDLKTLWNSEKVKELRRLFLEGKIPKQCISCFDKEKLGHESDRLKANQWYQNYFENVSKTSPDGELHFEALKSIDLRVSNICNYKCRTCTPSASSAWASDWPFISKEKFEDSKRHAFKSDKDALNYLSPATKNIDRIYFAGGEPFLQTEHYAVIEEIIKQHRANKVELFYNTNLSIIKFANKDIIKLLNQFSSVTFNLSIDATHQQGAYIRDGFNWEAFRANLNYFKSNLKNLRLTFNITVSNLNAFYLPEIVKSILEELNASEDQIIFNPVSIPSYYSVSNFPNVLKLQVTEKLKLASQTFKTKELSDKFLAMANFALAQSSKQDLKAFKQVTKRLDQIRGQSFVDLFPETKEMLD